MARKDTLNADNTATLNVMVAQGGEVKADAQVEGFNVRSMPKLVRMGLVAAVDENFIVTDAGYAAAGYEVVPTTAEVTEPEVTEPEVTEPETVEAEVTEPQQADEAPTATPAKPAGELDRAAKQALAGKVFAAAGDLLDGWDEAATGISREAAGRQLTAWLKYLPNKEWDARLPR